MEAEELRYVKDGNNLRNFSGIWEKARKVGVLSVLIIMEITRLKMWYGLPELSKLETLDVIAFLRLMELQDVSRFSVIDFIFRGVLSAAVSGVVGL